MSYCPVHGSKVSLIKEWDIFQVYQCPGDNGGVWVFDATFYPIQYTYYESLDEASDWFEEVLE